MQSLCFICVVVLVALEPGYVMGGVADQLAQIAEVCCNKGTSHAISHSSNECSSSVLPDVVPQVFSDFCKFSMKQCCNEYIDKNKDCDNGITVAFSKNDCEALTSVTGKNCCQQCLKGTSTGKSRGICVGGSRGSSAEKFLPTEAFEVCCKNATKYQFSLAMRPQREKKHYSSDIPSLCDEYGPHELCAHNCIPVPGAYKCECNPGYKLMSDKKNCMETDAVKMINRCKPRNPCQHKCLDNGVDVKCSCRKGYRLLPDKKSCEDIDECRMEPPVCSANTRCQNTKGAYKCLGDKKSHSEPGQCPPGFIRNPANGACDDINECTLLHPPCPLYLCENTVGGYKCGGISGDPANLPTKRPPPAEDRCPPGFKAGVSWADEECEDVDECETSTDDCNHQSQFCINTRGSFYCQDKSSKHCSPGFKINPVTNKCEDIDECVENHSLCPSNKICVNVPGAYDCKSNQYRSRSCPEGMRIKPGGVSCEDIDECLEGIHLCDQHQSCLNTNGSHECRCKLGFELDPLTGACVDINECATGQNDCFAESQRCDNTVGSYLCIRFMSCGNGYTLHHATGKCEDIDECALGKDNCNRAGPDFMCKNIPGFFRCVRKPSSTTTTAEPEYEYYYDSDDESMNETDSHQDGNALTDINNGQKTTTTLEPRTQSTPTKVSIPTFIIPTAVPTEPKVEEIQPKPEDKYDTDIKINEVISKTNKELLTPVIESRNSENTSKEDNPQNSNNDKKSEDANDVKPEYSKTKPDDQVYYVPRNQDQNIEQVIENDDKTKPHIVLLNVPNETVTVKAEKNDDGSLVINTKQLPKNEWATIDEKPTPSICMSGYEKDQHGTCVDIDECTTNKHVCSGLTEICRNNVGGYVCECAIGFRRDLRTGACDLLSSSTTSSTTAIPSSSTTENKHWAGYPAFSRRFRPQTICDFGLNMNSTTGKCEDIDECTNGQAMCAAVEVCVNTHGGYTCNCLPNWLYDDQRHRCVPNRDKSKFPPGYRNMPGYTNVLVGSNKSPNKQFEEPAYTKVNQGRTELKCRSGFQITSDNTCEDIDECTIGEAKCQPDQICTNLLGGYTCSCPPGHKVVNDVCQDIDECDLAGNTPICSMNADCINTIGSYQCKCHQGFRTAPANDKICMDVDECIESRSGQLCQQRCNNIWGGYRCSCHRGYRLSADNRTCSDLDECRDSKNLCTGSCLNEPGSYRCSCPKGYRLTQDQKGCIDIDECDTGEAFCANPVTTKSATNFCYNIRGGYKCEKIVCPPGYRLENRHRCTKIDRMCQVGDWDCIHQPSTYSYHYITFVSKLDIPDNKVDLYTMSVPAWPNARTKFKLRLIKADSPPTVKQRADIKSFLLTSTNKNAVVSLLQSLEGPQSLELELSMELYSDDNFAGIAVAKLFIYVTEYEF